MKKGSFILTVMTALLLAWALVCASVGAVPPDVVLWRLAACIVAFAVAGFCFKINRKVTTIVIFVALCLWGLVECGWGVAQLAGWARSRHKVFTLTGSFLNPGPYGGFLAMVAASCLAAVLKKGGPRWIKALAAVTMVFALVMTALSESRASWLGLIAAAAVILGRERGIFAKIKRKALFWSVAAVIGAAAAFGVWQLKPDSAMSRLHMWHIDCIAIAEHPLFGAGPGAEMGAYGQAQHDFFASNVRSEGRVKIADCPQFAFNEFLHMGMCCGIPGMLLAIAIYALALALMLRRRSVFTGVWVALGVFALFSFPLWRPLMTVLTALMLAECTAEDESTRTSKIVWAAVAMAALAVFGPLTVKEARSDANRKALMSDANKMETFLEKAETKLDKSCRYRSDVMFYYGRALYSVQKYDEAIEAFKTVEALSADPQAYNLHGESLRLMGDVQGAEEKFVYAHRMIPKRLYPLYFLIRLYKSTGLDEEAMSIREYALSLPYNPNLSETVKVRKQIEETY